VQRQIRQRCISTLNPSLTAVLPICVLGRDWAGLLSQKSQQDRRTFNASEIALIGMIAPVPSFVRCDGVVSPVMSQ
ncbi:MAG: hypothetical protein ACRETL_15125, partial [Gammaproteobacteria bacterium]